MLQIHKKIEKTKYICLYINFVSTDLEYSGSLHLLDKMLLIHMKIADLKKGCFEIFKIVPVQFTTLLGRVLNTLSSLRFYL